MSATQPIAVVGLACRFPGASDAGAFWDLLREGRHGLTRFTDEELAARGVPGRLRSDPRFVPVGGLIQGQGDFDPEPFGFTDAEAALLDPQHRLFLECAWHALEHAGHGGGRGAGAVGVFAGAMQSAYLAGNLHDRWDPTGGGRDPLGSLQTAISTQADYLPLQTAYRLDLNGPAVAVATSCSTSLVAVHLAAQSLVTGECDTALAGGVSLIVPQGQGYLHVPDGVFSADGAVRPFSEHGTGVVHTQGVGVVVLRRLDDALADGDPVLAVLHGSATNNDGADKAGFTAPSMRGQARVVAEALAVAGLSPRDVGLVEAHGTATRLGDPIEVAALRRVFGGTGPAWCGLGSVKGNIGHANSAAGIASFIKAVLAVHHRTLPATLGAHPLNPHLELRGSPFEVVAETRAWDTPPHAGVSSFGIGGTNCHAVLGPAPDLPAAEPDTRPQLLVVSAAGAEAARATAAAVAGAAVTVRADYLAHTLAVGRAELPYRVAAVGARRLASATPVRAADGPPRTVFAFPGAGSAYPGMGGGLYRDEPVFAAAVDACADLLLPLLGADVRDVLDPAVPADRVRDVAFGLPALFAVSYGVATLLGAWGVRPDALVGHSLGECTAAAVSGALPLPDAARLVAARCAAAARAAGGGAMLAVPLGEDAVVDLLSRHPDVDLAAVNGPAACVVSGPAAAVDAFAADLSKTGVPLRVDAAMHSRLMEPELPELLGALTGMAGQAPAVPVYSTVTGAQIGAELADPEHWARQLRSPVRFADALAAALADPTVLVEAGPGTALTTLARKNAGLLAAVPTLAPGEPECETAREALGALWAHGAPVNLQALSASGRRRVHAPGYAFQRRHLWIDPPSRTAADAGVDAHEPLQVPTWHQLPPAEPAAPPRGRWVVEGSGPLAAAIRDLLLEGGAEVLPLDAGPPSDPPGGLVVVADAPGAEADQAGAVASQVLRFGAVAAAAGPGTALLLVTRHGERVAGDPAPDPAQAALRTLPRVLGQEQPGLRWVAVDLGTPADPASEARAVLGELDAPAPGESGEIALRGAARWARRLTPWRPAAEVDRPPPGTVLIIGGMGAVGQLFARHLAARGHRVVITSRTARPTFDQDGVQVRRCEAADAAATAALLAELSADAPVELVVQAAGVVGEARPDPLRALDAEQVAGHARAKVGGTEALREAVAALSAARRPRTVLLMSSVTTLVGGVGMGPYAAANAAMGALSGRQEPTRWISAVWDGWRVAADGSEHTVVLAEALDADTGTRALDRLLAARASGSVPDTVVIAATDLNPRVAAANRPRQRGDGRTPASGVRLGDDEQAVAGLWAELFGVPVSDPEADFFALGGHSLLAVRMLGALGERFGVSLSLRDLLSAPTVAGMAGLIEAARQAERNAPDHRAEAEAHRAVAGDGTFPMTRVQHAYWVGRDGGYRWGDLPCHFYLEYDCPELDLARYEQAWNQVIARHPMLRCVTTSEGRWLELPDLPRYRIRVHDLAAVPEQRRAERLGALRERISTKPGPSDRWPLVQIQAARLPEGRVRLFIGVNVLVCDAASWWIVESELRDLYREPDATLPPVEPHPAACAAALEARRDERAAAYWRARLDVLPGPPRLPVREPAEGAPRFARRAVRLGREEWAALRDAAARHRVTPTAALLTVYADALAEWTGTPGFSLTLTMFDRPPIHPQVNQVVGDFTSLVLHEVPAVPAAGFAERAAATQARLFADLDHRAFSALEVLAEQAARTGEVRTVPVVFTSALGMDELLGGAGALEWAGQQVHAASQTPQTWLDHQVLEHDGELRLQWDALEGVLPGDELDRVISAHAARVRELAADPEAWTREPRIEPDARARRSSTGPGPVRRQGDVSTRDIVLPLRAAGGGERPVLYLAHPSGGDVLCYAELSRLLDPRVDVVALADPELAGAHASGPETVAGIAAQYLSAIGHGGRPWLLGGWSMGGAVAQEMARQLHETGEHVELLVMLDSNDPALIGEVPGNDAPEVELEVAVRHLRALEAFLGIDLDTGDALAAIPPHARLAAMADRLRGHRLLGRGEDLSGRLKVFARHLRALAAHTPGKLSDPGTATLLVRADRLAPRNSGIGMGVDDTPPGRDDLGWGAYLARAPHVAGVDAHHYSLLHPPALHAVAELINAALDQALARL
ncbi:SDR family NAD(P)-dependent oxidoreductase [Nonomuraea muscovyensis]|uniref:SDR family NAD(P)-dependent oxidoreductase n=1 Tax=Nonomuraea muscovyensis TaxID=1124761 RepID=UPI00340AF7D3